MSEPKDFLDDFDVDDGAQEPLDAADPNEAEDQQDTGGAVARDENGRFAKRQVDEDVDTGEEDATDEVDVQPPPGEDDGNQTVPFSAFKRLRKELQELKAKVNPDASQKAQPEQNLAPEFRGPEFEFQQNPQAYVQQQLHQQKMNMSHFMATQESSPDEVNEAWAMFDRACNSDPLVQAYSERLVNHPHPMGEVVKWYRQQRDLASLQEAGGLEGMRRRWMEEQAAQAAQGAPPAAATLAEKPQGRTRPPPSLARGSGAATGPEIRSEDEDFEALFKR